MIYLAPLQGFTDFIYRQAYSKVFNEVDAFFIPYIAMKNGTVLPKYRKEVLPENNRQLRAIPQVLAKDADEMHYLVDVLSELGYTEINLNLGCPYPMVNKRGRGSALLPHPEKLEEILHSYFSGEHPELSVKLRAGLNSSEELMPVIEVLNKFRIKEVILHPRIAKQLYSGEIIDEAFQLAVENLQHSLVYNGDIFSVSDFKKRQAQFSSLKHWMLGRGILMNPFLPMEINGTEIPENEKKNKLRDFHRLMLDGYSKAMDNEGNALNKMKQFWIYFCYNFPNPHKVLKNMKKANNILKFKAEAERCFALLGSS